MTLSSLRHKSLQLGQNQGHMSQGHAISLHEDGWLQLFRFPGLIALRETGSGQQYTSDRGTIRVFVEPGIHKAIRVSKVLDSKPRSHPSMTLSAQ